MKILPTRLAGPLLTTKRAGICCAMCATMACENAFTVSQSYFGRIGTTTCKPLPPLVFSQAGSPSSVRKARSSMAASRIAGQATALARVQVEHQAVRRV